ncbi:MAG: MarR family winged helix-turn-helix transcriptional regulator, partial [Gammaproteobacteria bacterium]
AVLERRCLIVRSKHATDARLRLVQLTYEGRKLTDEAMRRQKEIAAAMLAPLSAGEAELLRRVMLKMESTIDPGRGLDAHCGLLAENQDGEVLGADRSGVAETGDPT